MRAFSLARTPQEDSGEEFDRRCLIATLEATVDALELDAVGRVPWWPEKHNEVSLHRVLIHMIAETERTDRAKRRKPQQGAQ